MQLASRGSAFGGPLGPAASDKKGLQALVSGEHVSTRACGQEFVKVPVSHWWLGEARGMG